jgi:photosystem II stability/assembly factor-like uncharacterized protein
MINRTIFAALVLLSLVAEVQAQILWKHRTSDVWLNSETKDIDSSICFTALSCEGNNCTAAAILFNQIYPAGRLAFYHSDDGGLSWLEQQHNVPNKAGITNWGITKIQQIDSLHVVAIGDFGVVIRTTDAGTTWERIDCPAERKLLDVHFSDSLNGILVCTGIDSNIFTTTDGGEHWIDHQFTGANYSCHSYGEGKFSFYKYGHGPLYTTYNNFVTIDSTGLIFDSTFDPKFRYVLARCIYGMSDTVFAAGAYWPSDTVLMGGSNGIIMRSLDAGRTWEKPWIFPTSVLARVREVSSIDRDTIFAAGGDNRHYIMSTDHGKTWQIDSIMIDTVYETAKCFGMAVSKDGHPVAIFGHPGFVILSVLTRGEFIHSSVEVTERIKYNTYFYPNPTTGLVRIESIDKSKSPISVVDIFGRELLKSKLSETGKVTLDLSNLIPGIYNILLDYYGKVFIVGKVALIK